MRTPIPEELEQIAKDVVDAAIKLHIALGPSSLESVYTHRKITHKDTKEDWSIWHYKLAVVESILFSASLPIELRALVPPCETLLIGGEKGATHRLLWFFQC